ncbi:MAG: hypothetical protein Q4C91_21070 [Eubacteriales bacterium]|nr:hypothetical protein [Eubacteriales bacterium]
MMKRHTKIATAIALAASLCMSIPVQAARTEFNFYMDYGKAKIGFDAKKAGGSDFETVYYVRQDFTATSPSGSGRMYYNSCYDGSIVSNTLTLKTDDFAQHFYDYYSGQAKAGRVYQLRANFAVSTGGATYLQTHGFWTP